MSDARVPTIDDLRVKLCYICREEESYDKPEDPPRAWTHPCSCTLVAHESCLLQWIQSSQQNASRAPNALKCPQCGTRYEMESNNPLILKFLEAGNKALTAAGKMITVFSLATVVVSFGTAVYVVSTAYGAYAIREFLGQKMYDLLLTDDPANWPWHAFLNLPLIPISLIVSRTSLSSAVAPTIPLFLAWPTSTPVKSTQGVIVDFFAKDVRKTYISHPSLLSWPPSPALFGFFLFPLCRTFYRRYFTRFSNWLLDTPGNPAPRRGIWAEGEDVALEVEVNRPPQLAEHQQPQQDPPQENPAVAAEHTIRVSGASLGRLVGGALILPKVSNIMGNMLLRLSKRIPLLRHFLAVRSPTKLPLLGSYSLPANWNTLGPIRQIGLASRMALTAMWSGSSAWMEQDPVWWRNTIGFCLFIAAKDCVQLLHLWLAKRELESRKVMSRSFEGVDTNELDLIDSPRVQ